MKKLLPLVLFLLLCSTVSFAQDNPIERTEEYCEFRVINLSLLKHRVAVEIDYGDGPQDLLDNNKNRMEFKTKIGALNYLNSLGWELRHIRTVVDDGDSNSYYMMSRNL